jgi:hypothetical protein
MEINIKNKLQEIEREGMELINLAKLGKVERWFKHGTESFSSMRCGEIS